MDKIFKPSKELTFDKVQADHHRLRKQIFEFKSDTIQLDLHEVTACDSAGLALLIEAKRLCQQHNKGLNIIGASESIYALAEFCGVQSILPKRGELS